MLNLPREASTMPLQRQALGWNLFTPVSVLILYLSIVLAYTESGDEHLIMLSNGAVFLLGIANLLETRDIFHPFSMIPIVHGMYSLLPLLSWRNTEGSLLSVFGLEGGAIIF